MAINETLTFSGHHYLATRLLLSTLTGKPICINEIRPSSVTHPGLAPHEVCLLRLLDAVTNGTQIELSRTGTQLTYRPGLITGCAASGYEAGGGSAPTRTIAHSVPAANRRGITYFLLPLCLLAPFARSPLSLLLQGPGVITSAVEEHGDLSIDSLRTAVLPYFSHFGIPAKRIEISVKQRSCPSPQDPTVAGGQVLLAFNAQIRLPKTLHLMTPARRIRSIRGVAYAVGLSASNNARMIESARALLNHLCADVRIFSDNVSAPWIKTQQLQPASKQVAARADQKLQQRAAVGFGLSLVASAAGDQQLFSADAASAPQGGQSPEDVGRRAALQLLEVVSQGGCVPLTTAPAVLLFMALGAEDVGRVVLSKQVLAASPDLVALARDTKLFGLSPWAVRDADGQDGFVVVSMVGKGIGNVGRKMA